MTKISTHLRRYALVGLVGVGAVISMSAFAGKTDGNNLDRRIDNLSQQALLLGQNINQLQADLGEITPAANLSQTPKIRVSQSRQLGQINVRLDQLENQMRLLNGQVEGLQFQMTQLQTLLERMQEDYEFRFQELEGGAGGKTSAAPQPDSVTLSERLPQADTELEISNETLDIAGLSGSGQPLDLEFDAGTVLNDADASAQYQAGYEAILRGDYQFAKDQFSQYVALYPAQQQTADAYHWLGESLVQLQEYEEAAEVFITGYENFPNATRAPDMVLKLGITLAKTGERETACRTFIQLLRKFPNQPSAFMSRVKAEQKKTQC